MRGKRLLNRQTNQLRMASSEDIPALTKIKHQVAKNAYQDLFPKDKLDKWLETSCSEKFWEYRIGRKDYYVFVAIENGEIIGYSGYRKRGDRMDGSSVGLYVAKPGAGIGQKLNKLRMQHAKKLGCTKARVSCFRNNERAKNFVLAQGFKQVRAFREQKLDVMVDHYERELK